MTRVARRETAAGRQSPAPPATSPLEETLQGHASGRDGMRRWQRRIRENVYTQNGDFIHTLRYHLGDGFDAIHEDLARFGADVPTILEDLVAENDFRLNSPRVEQYDGIGDRRDRIVHHAAYDRAGDIIYGTDIVRRLVRPGGLAEGHAFYFLSAHAGDTGHNCPVMCNFETARLLRGLADFPDRDRLVAGLETPSYIGNITASQFLTEVQGGSDVGANATLAWKHDDGSWRIRGEKWFCSNANADVQIISARYDTEQTGSRGLAMFLVPARMPDGSWNAFTFRRLKEKIGTRALASAEIDYHDAHAIPLGPLQSGFKTLLAEVIHHSRLALATGVLGIARRGYQLARAYADERHAFGSPIIEFPLVQENLARLKADLVVTVAGTFALVAFQDAIDTGAETRTERRDFARLMTNIGKTVVSQRAVSMVHHAADTLAGNGMIETTSPIPRLYRDVTTWENWEGSHNTLRVQVLRDIERHKHDLAYTAVVEEMIAGLPASAQPTAGRALDGIREDLTSLRAAEARLQTLRMPPLVVRLADLFYYTAAVAEGAHQLESTGEGSKLAAAELYRRMHLGDESGEPDAEYLALIAQVVAAPSATAAG